MISENHKGPIVVVGFGWVGQANALALSLMGYSVHYCDVAEPELHYASEYSDVYARIGRISSPSEIDGPSTSYIVCVGDRVSEEGIQDISLIEKALNGLKGVQGTVILRSTIIPDRLAKLPFHFYVPEFLHEKLAVKESLDPYFFVVGRRGDRKAPAFLESWRKRAYKIFDGTPEEAAYIKYLSNLWNSVRIAFVNEFGNAIELPLGKEELRSIEKVTHFLFGNKSYLRYGKSFGGHCLPKDTRAFLRWYKDKGRDMSLLEGVYRSNAAHQLIEKKYRILPEWYSEWPDRHVSGKLALKSLVRTVTKRLKFLG